jgi:hypothetical protein
MQAHSLQNGIGIGIPPHGGWSAVNVPWSHAHLGNGLTQRYGGGAESLQI